MSEMERAREQSSVQALHLLADVIGMTASGSASEARPWLLASETGSVQQRPSGMRTATRGTAGRRASLVPPTPSQDLALLAVTAVASTAVTLLVALSPLTFAAVRPELRVALETAQAGIGLLVAFLFFGAARRSRLRRDLTVVAGFLLLGTTNLFYASTHAVAPAIDSQLFERFQVWFALTLRLTGAGLLAWAALSGVREHRLERPGRAVLTATMTVVISVALVVAAVVTQLPDPLVRLDQAAAPQISGHPTLVGVQLGMVLLWALAAVGFARRHVLEGLPVYLTMAIGAVLSAFSRINFFLYPSLYTEIVHVGDTFRLASYVVLAIGGASEISRYWRAEAEAAASGERERLARELHDGLSQELAFLRSQLMGRAGVSPVMLPHLADAADRAVTESRRIIRVLDPGEAEPLVLVLGRAAREVAERAGVEVRVEVDDAVQVPGEVVEELSRIVREATTNAVRHGAAQQLRVRLDLDGGTTVLTVGDDGVGFRPGDVSGGYGLRSMRGRAAAMRGELHVRSAPGEGTTVELRLP